MDKMKNTLKDGETATEGFKSKAKNYVRTQEERTMKGEVYGLNYGKGEWFWQMHFGRGQSMKKGQK